MSPANFTTITACRVCQATDLKPFFDLGRQPLANSLPERSDEAEQTYPLSLSWCPGCHLVQLNETVDPKALFSQYVWVTSTSSTARDYAETFYQRTIAHLARPEEQKFILEIASNDGTFLIPFRDHGHRMLGVDPAQNIVAMAEKNNVPTRCAFFGEAVAANIAQTDGPADVVIARNVLPHVANTRDFVAGIHRCLAADGIAIIEVHDAGIIQAELHYDSIYHEHLCYFTLKSLERLLNDVGLLITDLEASPISNGSMVIYATKRTSTETPAVQQRRDRESDQRTNEFSRWQQFADQSFKHRDRFKRLLEQIRRDGRTVVGYGASARSSTLLNFCGIGPELLTAIADENPLKQGRYTAGTHIPIVAPEQVLHRNPDYVAILAWNFSDEIMSILKTEYRFGGGVILPLPHTPRVIEHIYSDRKSMKFHEQKIKGVFIIEPEPFTDERGMFRRHFCSDEFASHGITAAVKQSNVSENKHRHTLRGFHYQTAPFSESKTLSCLKGSIYDVVVDLRPDSPSYLQWLAIELTAANRKSLHVPAGCANAFLTLEDDSLIHYYCSESYHPQAEAGVRYNDPKFAFVWPAEPAFISEKDRNWPDFVTNNDQGKVVAS